MENKETALPRTASATNDEKDIKLIKKSFIAEVPTSTNNQKIVAKKNKGLFLFF